MHGLLEIETLDKLLGHPVVGHSYEGMVIENLIAAAGEIAIEVKRSSAPSPEKGFALACDDLEIRKRFVVYPGIEQFGLRHGAQAISLRDMAQLLRVSVKSYDIRQAELGDAGDRIFGTQ